MSVMAKLLDQLNNCSDIPLYKDKLANCNLDSIKTIADFQEKIPLMTREELYGDFIKYPPYGSVWRSDVVWMHMTNAPELVLMPEYDTKKDIEALGMDMAACFRNIGVTSDDIAMITLSHEPYIGARLFEIGLEHIGAKFIPMGPGKAELQAEIIKRYRPTILIGAPSFATRIAEAGGEAFKGILKMFLSTGEPLLSIKGKREQVQKELGCKVYDFYGISECTPISCECVHQQGLHIVDDFVFVEVVDSETGIPLPHGQRGELVVTHLQKEAMPLIRFRTGDISIIEEKECICGSKITMPMGVFGRVGDMRKVKGVKFYPSTVLHVLASYPQISPVDYCLMLSNRGGKDYIKLRVKGNGDFNSYDELKAHLKSQTLITMDEIEVVDEIERKGWVDEREW